MQVEDTGRWYADMNGVPAFAHGVIRVNRFDAAGPEDGGSGARARARFVELIKSDVVEAGRAHRPLSLVVMAIDELGRLNDELGHEGADGVIREVTERIRSVMRARDRFARYSGNRFALALRACAPERAEDVVERIRDAMRSRPPAGPLAVDLRIGAATAPNHATDASTLLRRAEEALSFAARDESRPFVIHTLGMGQRPIERRGTAALDVIEALNSRRIALALQPVVEAGFRNIVFREALLRLRGPDGAIAMAGDVLPAIERSGLMPVVDARMLELAAAHLAEHPGERLSMNARRRRSRTPAGSRRWRLISAPNLGSRRA